MEIRLGPGGVPTVSREHSTLGGIQTCRELGLQAMEIEFVRGVKMSIPLAKQVGVLAKELDIRLSIHAPYYINLCNPEKQKASMKRILDSCERAHHLGAKVVAFHPGYHKEKKEEAMEMVVDACERMAKHIGEKGWKVKLGPETTGKLSQIGDIDEAIRQGALIAGKVGSGGDRDLQELLQPQIDWREVLREFIQTTCAGNDYSTWARPNRRYRAAGVYLPSGISEQVGELVVAVDTSGSIGQVELTAFMSEIKSICDTVHPECIRLLYWDTAVCQDEKYAVHELDDLTKTTKPKGGGGTNVECVPAYLTEHGVKPQAAIVLTDGYLGGSWGQWSCPVLWCILDNRTATPDTGKHVHIKSRDM